VALQQDHAKTSSVVEETRAHLINA
jgi:hypothetical protein